MLRALSIAAPVSLLAIAACSMDLGALQYGAPDAATPSTNPATDPEAGRSGGAAGTPAGGAGTPAAGANAAGSPPPPAAAGSGGATPVPPRRTCGVAGLPCCMPGNTCDLGACLRGKCTSYGGFYSRSDGCTQNPCGSRNAYTAGCACPSGFDDTLLWSRMFSCDTGDATTEVHSCTAARTPEAVFGGAWIEGPDNDCKQGCLTANPVTGQCGCPDGTQALALPIGPAAVSCGAAERTLQVCINAAGKTSNFGGAYALSQTAALGCGAPNPVTGSCSCPEEATAPQNVHAGTWSVFVCNL